MRVVWFAVFMVGVFVSGLAAQTVEKFDVFTFKAPRDWDKEIGKDTVTLGTEDAAKGTQCLITVFKTVPGSDDAKANFDASWETIVKELVTKVGTPERGSAVSEEGWMVESGVAPYQNDDVKGIAMLISGTGNGRLLNILIFTNSESYEPAISEFVASIKLPKVTAKPAPAAAPAKPTGEAARLIGRWQRSGSGAQPTYGNSASWGSAGYTKSRYEFFADGTYGFTERSFRMMMQDIIVVKENGTYSVSGNSLTVRPAKSTIASYKKAGGGDSLGALVSSQNRALETTTYKFTFHYFSGIQEWNLVLQADRVTQRDGAFSANTLFPNAWYFDQKFTDGDLTK